jgi:uncharacterized protein DUF4962/heparinase II/III-like protein
MRRNIINRLFLAFTFVIMLSIAGVYAGETPKVSLKHPAQPSIEELIKRLPEKHPKLFFRPETIGAYRIKLETKLSMYRQHFLDNAEIWLKDPIAKNMPEPYPVDADPFSPEYNKLRQDNNQIATNAVDHACNLAFAYMLNGDKRFGARAREWIMLVVSWPADEATSYKNNDEAALSIMCGIPRAYTWAYAALNGKERNQVIKTMSQRGAEVYAYSQDKTTPASLSNAWPHLGETAIAFIDDIPEARIWLKYALDIFYQVYPVLGDKDGGWHDGIAYWNKDITAVSWWLDIMKSAFDIDGYKHSYFSHAGDFPLYVSPSGTDFGFGDASDTFSSSELNPIMQVLSDRVGNPYWKWFAMQSSKPDRFDNFDYRDMLRLPESSISPVDPDEKLPDSKIFHDTGIASLHVEPFKASDDVHVLFKSSPLGTQSHGFNAQNSFLLWAFGKPLLTWSGHRDWQGSRHHQDWMWETFSDNCITVNGQGQKKHSADARGKIIAELLRPEFDYVAGDATEAYEGRLDKFVRHVMFVKPRIVIILDELQAPQPSTFQYHLNAPNKFSIKAQYEIETRNDAATARIIFATPDNLKITQTSGPNPQSIGFDQTQWRITAETPDKVKETSFLSIVRPYPSGKILGAKLENASRGKTNLCYFAVDSHRILMIHNPSRDMFTYGSIESDAGFLMMMSWGDRKEEAYLFVTDATNVKTGKQTLFESDKREPYFVKWQDVKDKIPQDK